jgi:hypothetical protein
MNVLRLLDFGIPPSFKITCCAVSTCTTHRLPFWPLSIFSTSVVLSPLSRSLYKKVFSATQQKLSCTAWPHFNTSRYLNVLSSSPSSFPFGDSALPFFPFLPCNCSAFAYCTCYQYIHAHMAALRLLLSCWLYRRRAGFSFSFFHKLVTTYIHFPLRSDGRSGLVSFRIRV